MANPEIPLAARIAAEVRALMAVQKKKLSDLAEYLKVDPRTAKKLWDGEKDYSLDQIDAIASWLGVETRVLTEGVYATVARMAVPA